MENVSEVFLSQDFNRDIAHALMLIQRKVHLPNISDVLVNGGLSLHVIKVLFN